jgi:trk system potassium uptake protein TrkA
MSNSNSAWLRRIWQRVIELAMPGGRPHTRRRLSTGQHNEFIVIGLGRFGTSLAMTLDAFGHEVLAIDSDPKRIQQVSQVLPHVIQLDATNIEALREVGAEAFDTGVVCIGNDLEANMLATVSLSKLGVRRVIAKARTTTQHDILLKVGADEVILPEHEAGVRLARKLAAVDFVDFMELTNDMGVVEIVTPAQFVGKTLRETEIRQNYQLTIVAIRRGDDVIMSPGASQVILEGDVLVVLGRTVDCERLSSNK